MWFEQDTQGVWGSRNMLLAAMLSQTLGINTIIILPYQAVSWGAVGHILLYSVIYIFIGIPLFYMEYVNGQFTGRNCFEMWKVRPFLSHVAYIQIYWQIMTIIFGHLFSSFVLHYFLISFEDPIPYYTCGPWTNKDCNLLYYNYTIHQDCLKTKIRLPYCANLCEVFPEYQYWRYFILGLNKTNFHLAWRVTLASGLICITLFISCFRTVHTSKWVLGSFTIFLIASRFLFFAGSMLQKGIVAKFEDAMDTDMTVFLEYIDISATTAEVLFSLNIGTGIGFNSASKSSFRSPCYSNTVVVVVITAAMTILGICSNALMLCPYSFRHGVHPFYVAKYPMFITYEKVPRLLHAYASKSFWLILTYSYITVSFLSINTLIISSLIEVLVKRYFKLSKYLGLVIFVSIMALYTITIPLFANSSFYFMVDIQRSVNVLLVFVILIECFVFLIFYGFKKFYEDVHFMLGVQPQAFLKISWILSVFVLTSVFCMEFYGIYRDRGTSVGTETGCWLSIAIITVTLLMAIIKVLKAAYKKTLDAEIGLDPNWGPKSDILKRSRAMFTTHAMTKEYIYRQYHLQAGILKRQKICNIRT